MNTQGWDGFACLHLDVSRCLELSWYASAGTCTQVPRSQIGADVDVPSEQFAKPTLARALIYCRKTHAHIRVLDVFGKLGTVLAARDELYPHATEEVLLIL